MESNDDRGTTGRRSRVEDEVIEILNRTDRPISFADHVRQRRAQQRPDRVRTTLDDVRSRLLRLGSGGWLIGCVVAALVAVAIEDSSALLARLLAVSSFAMLLVPIVNGLRRPQQPSARTWRGREINYRPNQPPWFESLRERFRRPPQR